MKKIYILSIIGCLAFTACDQDIDIWDSETLDYSGRFLFEFKDAPDKDQGYSMDKEIQLFNTSNNVANEIWIDDIYHEIPFKSKFFLEGDASSFKSKTTDFNQLTDNEYSFEFPSDNPETADDREEIPQYYLRCYINEGKIIPGGATTIGGNQADSIYIKLTLYNGTVYFKSAFIPEDERTDPSVAYKWEIDKVTTELDENDPDMKATKTYILSGHRYTGYPEDVYE
ncbi:MAG: hypothetical protein LBV74_11445 [Tannerella sp.]|jgi:hypothetical protein|nr:hypothetical protein [Tannerella sp.]